MERIQASCSSQQEKRNNAPNPRSIPNREAFQRMSFLYQASAYLNNVGIALQQSGCSSQRNKIPKGRTEDLGENADENLDADEYDRDANAGGSLRSLADTNGKKRASSKRMATLDDLGATYINDLRVIGTKSVLRIDPAVKRRLCRACNTVLIPGTTTSVRIKSLRNRSSKKVVYTCLNCKSSRSIPAMPAMLSQTVREDTMECDMVETGNNSTEAALSATGSANPSDAAVNTGAKSGKGLSQKKHQRQRRQVNYKAPLLSEQRDVGHMVAIGNEAVPFE